MLPIFAKSQRQCWQLRVHQMLVSCMLLLVTNTLHHDRETLLDLRQNYKKVHMAKMRRSKQLIEACSAGATLSLAAQKWRSQGCSLACLSFVCRALHAFTSRTLASACRSTVKTRCQVTLPAVAGASPATQFREEEEMQLRAGSEIQGQCSCLNAFLYTAHAYSIAHAAFPM